MHWADNHAIKSLMPAVEYYLKRYDCFIRVFECYIINTWIMMPAIY